MKLACVNWYGAHMEGHVVNGLDKRSIEGIATTIASLGFNCVRQTNPLEVPDSGAPSCLLMAQISDIEWTSLMSDCPCLWSSSITISTLLQGLTEAGLMVILNNHNSRAG